MPACPSRPADRPRQSPPDGEPTARVIVRRFGATFVNTARWSRVDEAGLCRVLVGRPDLQAVRDTNETEPPPADSPLYTLPHVVLTPHVAGSVAGECRRMGRLMA